MSDQRPPLPEGFPPQPPNGYPQQPQYVYQQQQPNGVPQGYPRSQQFGYQQQPGTYQPPAPKHNGRVAAWLIAGVIAIAAATIGVMAMLGVFSDEKTAEPSGSSNPIVTDDSVPTDDPTDTGVEESDAPDPEPTSEEVDNSELDLSPRDPSVPFPETSVDWMSGSVEAFAARDQFFVDQGVPLNGELLTATTPEQRTFVARQVEFVESQGGATSPEYEAVILSLALDACETSILNAHIVTISTYDMHVAGSPLFAELLKDVAPDQQEVVTQNLESIMIFGVSYICQGDTQDWADAFETRHGIDANYR